MSKLNDRDYQRVLDDLNKESKASSEILDAQAAIRKRIANLDIVKIEFPLDCLPPRVEAFVRGYVTTFGVAPDFYGTTILTVTGAVIGNAAWLLNRTTTHPAILQTVLVAVPADGKTPTIKTVLAPLIKLEEEARKEHAIAVQEAKLEAELDKDNKHNVYEVPAPREYLVNDFTMEALVDTLENNPRGTMAWSDEASGFLANQDKYRDGGDAAFWLSAYTGETYKKNRRNQGRAIYVKSVFCPFVGGIQPSLLKKFADGDRAESGGLARNLFAYPELQPKQYYHKNYPSADHALHWDRLVRKIYKVQPKEVSTEADGMAYHVPHKVQLSKGAEAVYAGFFNGLMDRINAIGTEDMVKRSTLAKFETHVLRFALILHFLWWASIDTLPEAYKTSDQWLKEGSISPSDIVLTEISKATMERAVRIAEYFMATGLQVVGKLKGPHQHLPPKQLAWYEECPPEVTREHAIATGETAGMSKSTVKRLLTRKDLFYRAGRGEYSRIHF